MYKIYLCKEGKSEEITNLVSDLSWNESLDTVGVSLSFSVPDTAERYIPHLLIEAGDIIRVHNDDGELFRVVVILRILSKQKRCCYTIQRQKCNRMFERTFFKIWCRYGKYM